MNTFSYFWQKFFMRIPLYLTLAVLINSCSIGGSREFTTVNISTIFEDSLSIRAIAPLDSERVWFAANAGRVGLIDHGTPKLASIKYEDSLLHFRTIAALRNTVFVLSVGSPGVLYKIGFDGSEATNIEEVYVEEGANVFYDAMAFWDEREGIAMGDPTDTCMSVIITRDGGNSWKKIPCTSLPGVEKGEAAFAASNSNISVYGNHVWMVSGGKRARVFHSDDRGESWEVFETPIIQGKAMTGIYSVDFLDKKTGVIFGGNWDDKDFNEGNKAITNDGGKSWELISNGSGPGYRSSVRFVPGTKGRGIVAVGSPGISYSPDKGESWVELSSEGFYAIEFVNDTLAFASGRNRISKLIFR